MLLILNIWGLIGFEFKYIENPFWEEENEREMYKSSLKYITFVKLVMNHNWIYGPADSHGFFISCVFSGVIWICAPMIPRQEKKIIKVIWLPLEKCGLRTWEMHIYFSPTIKRAKEKKEQLYWSSLMSTTFNVPLIPGYTL